LLEGAPGEHGALYALGIFAHATQRAQIAEDGPPCRDAQGEGLLG